MKRFIALIPLVVLLAGCAGSIAPQPTATRVPSPTFTETPTIVPTETKTPIPTETVASNTSQDQIDSYLSLLPADIPENMEWKILPEYKLAILLPDGWYFKQEDDPGSGVSGAAYVTMEDIEAEGRFSTGLTVFIYPHPDDDMDGFAQGLLSSLANADTTQQVLRSWDYTSGDYVVHHLRLEGYFPNETEANQYKTLQYSTTIANDAIYVIIFECPTDQWEQITEQYGILMDYTVIFQSNP